MDIHETEGLAHHAGDSMCELIACADAGLGRCSVEDGCVRAVGIHHKQSAAVHDTCQHKAVMLLSYTTNALTPQALITYSITGMHRILVKGCAAGTITGVHYHVDCR